MDDPAFWSAGGRWQAGRIRRTDDQPRSSASPHEHQCGARLRMLGEGRASRLAVMDRAELAGSSPLSQPSSSTSWLDWAQYRWASLTTQDRWPSLTTP